MENPSVENNDIYGDLDGDVTDITEEVDRPTLIKFIIDLKADVAKLCAELVKFRNENDNLKKNISSLFTTSQKELQRKENIINDLRRNLDDLHFRRETAGKKRCGETLDYNGKRPRRNDTEYSGSLSDRNCSNNPELNISDKRNPTNDNTRINSKDLEKTVQTDNDNHSNKSKDPRAEDRRSQNYDYTRSERSENDRRNSNSTYSRRNENNNDRHRSSPDRDKRSYKRLIDSRKEHRYKRSRSRSNERRRYNTLLPQRPNSRSPGRNVEKNCRGSKDFDGKGSSSKKSGDKRYVNSTYRMYKENKIRERSSREKESNNKKERSLSKEKQTGSGDFEAELIAELSEHPSPSLETSSVSTATTVRERKSISLEEYRNKTKSSNDETDNESVKCLDENKIKTHKAFEIKDDCDSPPNLDISASQQVNEFMAKLQSLDNVSYDCDTNSNSITVDIAKSAIKKDRNAVEKDDDMEIEEPFKKVDIIVSAVPNSQSEAESDSPDKTTCSLNEPSFFNMKPRITEVILAEKLMEDCEDNKYNLQINTPKGMNQTATSDILSNDLYLSDLSSEFCTKQDTPNSNKFPSHSTTLQHSNQDVLCDYYSKSPLITVHTKESSQIDSIECNVKKLCGSPIDINRINSNLNNRQMTSPFSHYSEGVPFIATTLFPGDGRLPTLQEIKNDYDRRTSVNLQRCLEDDNTTSQNESININKENVQRKYTLSGEYSKVVDFEDNPSSYIETTTNRELVQLTNSEFNSADSTDDVKPCTSFEKPNLNLPFDSCDVKLSNESEIANTIQAYEVTSTCIYDDDKVTSTPISKPESLNNELLINDEPQVDKKTDIDILSQKVYTCGKDQNIVLIPTFGESCEGMINLTDEISNNEVRKSKNNGEVDSIVTSITDNLNSKTNEDISINLKNELVEIVATNAHRSPGELNANTCDNCENIKEKPKAEELSLEKILKNAAVIEENQGGISKKLSFSNTLNDKSALMKAPILHNFRNYSKNRNINKAVKNLGERFRIEISDYSTNLEKKKSGIQKNLVKKEKVTNIHKDRSFDENDVKKKLLSKKYMDLFGSDSLDFSPEKFSKLNEHTPIKSLEIKREIIAPKSEDTLSFKNILQSMSSPKNSSLPGNTTNDKSDTNHLEFLQINDGIETVDRHSVKTEKIVIENKIHLGETCAEKDVDIASNSLIECVSDSISSRVTVTEIKMIGDSNAKMKISCTTDNALNKNELDVENNDHKNVSSPDNNVEIKNEVGLPTGTVRKPRRKWVIKLID